ncbi:hypothetical protein [Desertivirga brevis]|uniref:hypothetical protein n=1 Tax=Desertivirga brevis TaxID=2810310 RepID=UPI001A9671F6|nr:hypothetical protein [Pedobacter sp. SYSU D00873]
MYKTLKTPLFTALLFATSLTLAQEKPLVVETRVNSNNSVDFNYTKTDPASYTVIVNFGSLRNTTASERQVTQASSNSGKLFSLNPSTPNLGIGYSYKYYSLRGKVLRKYNSDVQYLLPYKAGTKVRAIEAGYVPAMYFGSEMPSDWKCYNFYTSEEDTVLATRKGVVVQVKDLYETSKPGDEAFKSAMNEILIEHTDGTFCKYRGLKKGAFVTVGQTVLPGTPLGMNSLFHSTSRQYNIMVHLYYLSSDDIESMRDQTLKTSKSLYSSITPHFYTKEGENIILENRASYTAASSSDIIKKELSKKELKNMAKN